MKSSSELLREYANLIAEAEDEFSPEDFEPNSPDAEEDDNQPTNDDDFEDTTDVSGPPIDENDPIAKLAEYLDSSNEDNISMVDLIRQFLKENHLDLVPTRGLENPEGNV